MTQAIPHADLVAESHRPTTRLTNRKRPSDRTQEQAVAATRVNSTCNEIKRATGGRMLRRLQHQTSTSSKSSRERQDTPRAQSRASKLQRNAVAKEKRGDLFRQQPLSESKQRQMHNLDILELAIHNEAHIEWTQMLQDIEAKRASKVKKIKLRYDLVKESIKKDMMASQKMADDQFHWNKLAARQSMIKTLQCRISTLEKELNDHPDSRRFIQYFT